MSDRLHLALGKFVAHWALADHELVIGIHHMALSANHKLKTDPRGAPLAPARAKERQAIFAKLLKSLSQDKALTGLSDKVLGTIARLRGRRDDLMHGHWFLSGDETIRIIPAISNIPESVRSQYSISLSELEEDAKRIESYPEAISLIVALASWRVDSEKAKQKYLSLISTTKRLIEL